MFKFKIKNKNNIKMLKLEKIVPQNSIFIKIKEYIDFSFIYDEVKHLYCLAKGRPCIDSVILFKIIFIQVLDRIKSVRKTFKKLEFDAEYR